MKEKASPKRLKGTVLFTVVSVMMVLIVFLMGTLALAATASNRAASNYQKAQTEATARTVIDSVVQAVNSNADIRATVAALAENASTPVTVAGSDGIDVTATITNVGTQPMFDESAQEWNDGKLFQVTTTVGKTKAETTYSAYFSAVIPETEAPGAGGGAFVSLGDMSGTEVATGGYITGGTFINIQQDPGADPETFYFTKNGTMIVDAPFYLDGNVDIRNKFYMHFRLPGDYFVITNNLTYTDIDALQTDYEGFTGTISNYKDVPFLYVGNLFNFASKTDAGAVKFGDEAQGIPFNIFCGQFKTGHDSANFSLYGDMYNFLSNVDNVFSGSDNTRLYKWASSTLTNSNGDSAMGNWYSAGNVTISKNLTIDGDLRVEGNVTISSNVTVGGDVVVGGTLEITAGTLECGNIYATNVENKGTIDCSGTVKAKTYGGTGTLKDKVVPTQQVQVSYVENTPTTYELKATHDWGDQYAVTYDVTISRQVINPDGSLAPATTETRTETEKWVNVRPAGQVVTAASLLKELGIENGTIQEYATTSPFVQIAAGSDVETEYGKIYPEAYDKDNIAGTVLTQPVISDYTNYPDEPSDLGSGIWSGGHFVIPEYTDATLPKETRADGTEISNLAVVTESCVLSGDFNSSIYIDPESGPVTVVLRDVTMTRNEYMIVVNDDKDVTLFIQGTLKIIGGGLITKDYLDLMGVTNAALVSKDEIRGDVAAVQPTKINTAEKWKNGLTIPQNSVKGDKTYPNVIIYGDKDSVLDMAGASNSLLTALVRAPQLTFRQGLGLEAQHEIDYVNPGGGIKRYGVGTTGSNSDKNKYVGVIGQLVAQHIELTNNADWGLIFINAGTPKKCTCGCAACIDPEHPTKCTCKSNGCTCPDCICTGDLAGYGTPDAYTILNYDFY